MPSPNQTHQKVYCLSDGTITFTPPKELDQKAELKAAEAKGDPLEEGKRIYEANKAELRGKSGGEEETDARKAFEQTEAYLKHRHAVGSAVAPITTAFNAADQITVITFASDLLDRETQLGQRRVDLRAEAEKDKDKINVWKARLIELLRNQKGSLVEAVKGIFFGARKEELEQLLSTGSKDSKTTTASTSTKSDKSKEREGTASEHKGAGKQPSISEFVQSITNEELFRAIALIEEREAEQTEAKKSLPKTEAQIKETIHKQKDDYVKHLVAELSKLHFLKDYAEKSMQEAEECAAFRALSDGTGGNKDKFIALKYALDAEKPGKKDDAAKWDKEHAEKVQKQIKAFILGLPQQQFESVCIAYHLDAQKGNETNRTADLFSAFDAIRSVREVLISPELAALSNEAKRAEFKNIVEQSYGAKGSITAFVNEFCEFSDDEFDALFALKKKDYLAGLPGRLFGASSSSPSIEFNALPKEQRDALDRVLQYRSDAQKLLVDEFMAELEDTHFSKPTANPKARQSALVDFLAEIHLHSKIQTEILGILYGYGFKDEKQLQELFCETYNREKINNFVERLDKESLAKLHKAYLHYVLRHTSTVAEVKAIPEFKTLPKSEDFCKGFTEIITQQKSNTNTVVKNLTKNEVNLKKVFQAFLSYYLLHVKKPQDIDNDTYCRHLSEARKSQLKRCLSAFQRNVKVFTAGLEPTEAILAHKAFQQRKQFIERQQNPKAFGQYFGQIITELFACVENQEEIIRYDQEAWVHPILCALPADTAKSVVSHLEIKVGDRARRKIPRAETELLQPNLQRCDFIATDFSTSESKGQTVSKATVISVQSSSKYELGNFDGACAGVLTLPTSTPPSTPTHRSSPTPGVDENKADDHFGEVLRARGEVVAHLACDLLDKAILQEIDDQAEGKEVPLQVGATVDLTVASRDSTGKTVTIVNANVGGDCEAFAIVRKKNGGVTVSPLTKERNVLDAKAQRLSKQTKELLGLLEGKVETSQSLGVLGLSSNVQTDANGQYYIPLPGSAEPRLGLRTTNVLGCRYHKVLPGEHKEDAIEVSASAATLTTSLTVDDDSEVFIYQCSGGALTMKQIATKFANEYAKCDKQAKQEEKVNPEKVKFKLLTAALATATNQELAPTADGIRPTRTHQLTPIELGRTTCGIVASGKFGREGAAVICHKGIEKVHEAFDNDFLEKEINRLDKVMIATPNGKKVSVGGELRELLQRVDRVNEEGAKITKKFVIQTVLLLRNFKVVPKNQLKADDHKHALPLSSPGASPPAPSEIKSSIGDETRKSSDPSELLSPPSQAGSRSEASQPGAAITSTGSLSTLTVKEEDEHVFVFDHKYSSYTPKQLLKGLQDLEQYRESIKIHQNYFKRIVAFLSVVVTPIRDKLSAYWRERLALRSKGGQSSKNVVRSIEHVIQEGLKTEGEYYQALRKEGQAAAKEGEKELTPTQGTVAVIEGSTTQRKDTLALTA